MDAAFVARSEGVALGVLDELVEEAHGELSHGTTSATTTDPDPEDPVRVVSIDAHPEDSRRHGGGAGVAGAGLDRRHRPLVWSTGNAGTQGRYATVKTEPGCEAAVSKTVRASRND